MARKPISRTRSKPAMASSEFQNSRCVCANRPLIVDSTPASSQAGIVGEERRPARLGRRVVEIELRRAAPGRRERNEAKNRPADRRSLSSSRCSPLRTNPLATRRFAGRHNAARAPANQADQVARLDLAAPAAANVMPDQRQRRRLERRRFRAPPDRRRPSPASGRVSTISAALAAWSAAAARTSAAAWASASAILASACLVRRAMKSFIRSAASTLASCSAWARASATMAAALASASALFFSKLAEQRGRFLAQLRRLSEFGCDRFAARVERLQHDPMGAEIDQHADEDEKAEEDEEFRVDSPSCGSA